jgi:hypothetical protein
MYLIFAEYVDLENQKAFLTDDFHENPIALDEDNVSYYFKDPYEFDIMSAHEFANQKEALKYIDNNLFTFKLIRPNIKNIGVLNAEFHNIYDITVNDIYYYVTEIDVNWIWNLGRTHSNPQLQLMLNIDDLRKREKPIVKWVKDITNE